MSPLPHNASLRPEAVGEPAPSPAEPQISQIPQSTHSFDDGPTDTRERNPKRRKTDSSGPVPILTNIRSRICAKFDVEMGDNVRETLNSMW